MTARSSNTVSRICSEGVLFTVGNMVSRATFLAMTIVLTRLFTPQEYGRYALVKTTILLGAVLDTWLLESVMRFHAEHVQNGRTACFVRRIRDLAGRQLALTVGLAVCAILLVPMDPTTCRFLLTATVIYGLDFLYRLHLQFLRARRDALGHSLSSLAYAALRLGVAVALIFAWRRSIESVLYAWIGADALLIPVLARRVGRGNRVTAASPGECEPADVSVRQLLQYGAPFVPLALGWMGLYIADRFMLQWFHGAGQVGLYGLACSLAELGYIIPYTLIAMPAFAATVKMCADGREHELPNELTRLVRCHLLVAVPLVMALGTLATPVIATFTRDAYLPAARALPLLAPGLLGWGLLAFSNIAFMVKKRTGLLACLGTAGLGGNLVLNALLIPRFGLTGAAAATSLTYLGLVVAGWVTARIRLGLCPRMPWRSAANALVASAAMVAGTQIVVRVLPAGILPLAATGFAGGIVYVATLLLLGEWRLHDGRQIARGVMAIAKGAI